MVSLLITLLVSKIRYNLLILNVNKIMYVHMYIDAYLHKIHTTKFKGKNCIGE